MYEQSPRRRAALKRFSAASASTHHRMSERTLLYVRSSRSPRLQNFPRVSLAAENDHSLDFIRRRLLISFRDVLDAAIHAQGRPYNFEAFERIRHKGPLN
jgi:hypothetical protein